MMKAVLKNQRATKQKQKHMKSILSQVKNKNIIEELEIYQKNSDFDILSYKPNWKELQNGSLITKRLAKSSRQSHFRKTNQNTANNLNKQSDDSNTDLENKQNADKYVNNFIIKQELQEQQSTERRKQKKSEPTRNSSRIELQLKQIMQYSQMYPSRNTNHKSLQKKISKIDNFFFRNLKSSSNLINRGEKGQEISRINHQFHTDVTKSRFYNSKKGIKNIQHNLDEQNMILDIVDNEGIVADYEEDKAKKKQTRDLLKKTRNTTLIVTNNKPFDYSLTSFLEQQMNQLRSKAGRKTVGSHVKTPSSCDVTDIRNENINDLHRFLRGQARDDEEISNYMTGKQIRKYQNKYQLYESIYKKTKQDFNSEKLDLNLIRQLTVKHAIFLNQAFRQNNNWVRRQEILKTMKNLNFYQ